MEPTALIDGGSYPPRVRQVAPDAQWIEMQAIHPAAVLHWANTHPHGVWVLTGLAAFVHDFSSHEREILERCYLMGAAERG